MADMWNNSSVTGDISDWNFSTGSTFSPSETPEESRKRRKKLIKSLLEDDDYLLQELITDLRKEKINQLKNASKY